MKNEVHYLMSQKQLNRYKIISSVIDGNLTIGDAAKSLGLSERQIKRLKKGVMNEGVAFLIHKNIGSKPKHAISDETKDKITTLKESDPYKEANFNHFMELIEEHEGIKVSYSCLHNILTEAGIKSPKKRRRFKPHRRRKRKSQEGLLIQVDATPHNWFNSNTRFSLHGAIDDATGKVVSLYMAKNECLQGYFELVRHMTQKYGIPVSLYSDRHTIFLSPKKDKLSVENQLSGKLVNDTQFGRAMKELGITIIPARSPQAKGRIERLWETLQSRLPIEFKIAGITTVDQANEFLVDYIEKFNKQFAVEAENTEIAYRTLENSLNIDHILCVKYLRSVDNGGVFSFANRHFKITGRSKAPIIPPRAKVEVLISPIFKIKVQYKKAVYEVLPYAKQKRCNHSSNVAPKSRKKYIPPDSHYYKYGHTLIKKTTFEDSDKDIIEMLEGIFLKQHA